MPIDDAEKRRAAANVAKVNEPGVTPNASPDVEWRQQVANSYSGIAPATPGAPTNPLLLALLREGLFVGDNTL